MHPPDTEFDPDDNYAGSFDAGMEIDDEADTEVLVWQLLLLVNPGDEEAALQQFAAYRDVAADAGEEGLEPASVLQDVIDWKSGFQVHDDDAAALVECITELVARWNLEIDWGVEDPDDGEFLAGTTIGHLLHVAYDALRAYGYTLWVWETASGNVAGWIASSRDDDAMRVLAPALGIELRPGGLA